jgi:hypothetical protein
MTTTPTRAAEDDGVRLAQPGDSTDPQAVIAQARARQRRRWRVAAAMVTVAAGAAIWALVAGLGWAAGPAGVRSAGGGSDGIAASRTGVITGRMEMSGVTLKGPFVSPVRGTVAFTRPGHRVRVVQVGRSGTFAVHLPPGTYHVFGRSPMLVQVGPSGVVGGPGSTESPIRLGYAVTVTAGHTIKIVINAVVPA